MTNFETIDSCELHVITGGQMIPGSRAGNDAPDGGDQPRTWKGVAKGYARACIQGAGENLMMMGMMGGVRGVGSAASAAGMGCAMGVGMQLLNDGVNTAFGGE
ncbi:MAG TPA: hypothetical protein VFQ53_36610 [Kofleriaceae bacterium]|nr:hypothetical protein [Kofleriaceae bacterium]